MYSAGTLVTSADAGRPPGIVEFAASQSRRSSVSHRNARLTVHGRRLLVHRVRGQGQAIAHVAKAMGVSRQCAHRWVARYDAEGDDGLTDRSSRPRTMPTRASDEIEAKVLAARTEHRKGQDWLAAELGGGRGAGGHGTAPPHPPHP